MTRPLLSALTLLILLWCPGTVRADPPVATGVSAIKAAVQVALDNNRIQDLKGKRFTLQAPAEAGYAIQIEMVPAAAFRVVPGDGAQTGTFEVEITDPNLLVEDQEVVIVVVDIGWNVKKAASDVVKGTGSISAKSTCHLDVTFFKSDGAKVPLDLPKYDYSFEYDHAELSNFERHADYVSFDRRTGSQVETKVDLSITKNGKFVVGQSQVVPNCALPESPATVTANPVDPPPPPLPRQTDSDPEDPPASKIPKKRPPDFQEDQRDQQDPDDCMSWSLEKPLKSGNGWALAIPSFKNSCTRRVKCDVRMGFGVGYSEREAKRSFLNETGTFASKYKWVAVAANNKYVLDDQKYDMRDIEGGVDVCFLVVFEDCRWED